MVKMRVTQATGTAERDAALQMIQTRAGTKRITTLGGDKNYDTREWVRKLRKSSVEVEGGALPNFLD